MSSESRGWLGRVVADHREHRPGDLREVALYLLEIWLAAGLLWRGVWHWFLWGLIRAEYERYDSVPPDTKLVDCGIDQPFAVDQSGLEDPLPAETLAKIQLLTAFGTAGFLLYLKSAAAASNWPVVLAVLGPSIVYVCLDPVWGALAAWRSASSA